MLYVIFLGSDYDKRRKETRGCLNARGKYTQEGKRTNKHRGLLEEVIDRGDKHIKLIAALQDIKRGTKE